MSRLVVQFCSWYYVELRMYLISLGRDHVGISPVGHHENVMVLMHHSFRAYDLPYNQPQIWHHLKSMTVCQYFEVLISCLNSCDTT